VGEQHTRRRRLIEPLFHEREVARYAAPIVEATEAVSSSWRDGAVVDVETEMERCGAEAVAAALFDGDLPPIHDVLFEYHRLSRAVVTRAINQLAPLLWRLPLPLTRRFLAAQARLGAAVEPLVTNRRDAVDRGDLLTALARARTAEGGRLADHEAGAEAATYFLQGAPGVGVTWIWWLLGTHPTAEARLHEELDHRLHDGVPTAGDLDALEYTRAVILEGLRLYPPGMGMLRKAATSFELDGVSIPAGRWVLVSYWVLHRDERFWPAASTFDPERWLGEREREIPPFAYLTFAAGARRCPARTFALLLCRLMLATLASRWRLRPMRPNVEIGLVPFLHPRGGLPMRVERRKDVA
jgi:cytochrome P450